ncbi:hypothetical protein [Nesterenkonia suensis]
MSLVLVGVLVLTNCGGPPQEVSVEQSGGGEIVVDWSEGLTYEEQVEEIKLVNEVMVEHFGENVLTLDGGEWDLKEYLEWPGIPYSSHRAQGAYYFRIDYDFSEVEPSQETVDKAWAVLEEIGLTPNQGVRETYDEDQNPPLRVSGGQEESGRLFMIRQLKPGAEISAVFSTRHSDDESMYEAHEANWDD